jgi:hypothetical protein
VIESEAQKWVQGPMGRDVTTTSMVPQASPILGPNGQPVITLVPQKTTTRQLRPDVPAKEALESARETSARTTRRQYGEMKSASTEAAKAGERAQRDAVKTAIPETKPLFMLQAKGSKARDVLDRMELRELNREPISLPEAIAGSAEITAGKIPVLTMLLHLFRSGKLRGGIYADAAAKALQTNDAQAAGTILSRLGVGTAAQATGGSEP